MMIATAAPAQRYAALTNIDPPRAFEAPALSPAAIVVAMETRLASEERRFSTWRTSWMLAYSALVLGNLALAPVVARADRVDYYTGAVTSAVGVATLALQPEQAPVTNDCAAGTDHSTACLGRRYREVSAFQRSSRGWLAHALCFAFNAGVSAFLALGYDRWRSAAANLVMGTAIGEWQIATQPHGALEMLGD